MFRKEEKKEVVRKEQISFRVNPYVLDELREIDKFHSKISDILALGIDCYKSGIKKETFEYVKEQELQREFIQVFFRREKDELSVFWDELARMPKKEDEINRKWFTHENLSLIDDYSKIELYKTCDYLNISDVSFKVVKREFKPDRPAMLILTLRKVEE